MLSLRRIEIGPPEIAAIPQNGRFIVVAGDHLEILDPAQISAAILDSRRSFQ